MFLFQTVSVIRRNASEYGKELFGGPLLPRKQGQFTLRTLCCPDLGPRPVERLEGILRRSPPMDLVVMPEYSLFPSVAQDPWPIILSQLQNLAKLYRINIAVGTVPHTSEVPFEGRTVEVNGSALVMINNKGKIVGRRIKTIGSDSFTPPPGYDPQALERMRAAFRSWAVERAAPFTLKTKDNYVFTALPFVCADSGDEQLWAKFRNQKFDVYLWSTVNGDDAWATAVTRLIQTGQPLQERAYSWFVDLIRNNGLIKQDGVVLISHNDSAIQMRGTGAYYLFQNDEAINNDLFTHKYAADRLIVLSPTAEGKPSGIYAEFRLIGEKDDREPYEGSDGESGQKNARINMGAIYGKSTIFPNPSNGLVAVSFVLKREAEVSLAVYDSIGRKAGELPPVSFPKGSHSFSFDTSRLASGTYFAVLTADGKDLTNKMVVVR